TRFDGRLIAVEREHATFSTQGLEKACRVPAAPERRIDIEPIRFGSERRERFIDKHRSVLIHKSPSAEAVWNRPPKCRVADQCERAPLRRCLLASPENPCRFERSPDAYSVSESSSDGRSVVVSSLVSHKSRRPFQRVSSHSSKRL